MPDRFSKALTTLSVAGLALIVFGAGSRLSDATGMGVAVMGIILALVGTTVLDAHVSRGRSDVEQ